LIPLFKGSQIESTPLELVLQHSSHACIWLWGELGLHFLSLSRNKGGSLKFIKVAARELNIDLIGTSSLREIPSW
jgi:hypothetical protein